MAGRGRRGGLAGGWRAAWLCCALLSPPALATESHDGCELDTRDWDVTFDTYEGYRRFSDALRRLHEKGKPLFVQLGLIDCPPEHDLLNTPPPAVPRKVPITPPKPSERQLEGLSEEARAALRRRLLADYHGVKAARVRMQMGVSDRLKADMRGALGRCKAAIGAGREDEARLACGQAEAVERHCRERLEPAFDRIADQLTARYGSHLDDAANFETTRLNCLTLFRGMDDPVMLMRKADLRLPDASCDAHIARAVQQARSGSPGTPRFLPHDESLPRYLGYIRAMCSEARFQRALAETGRAEELAGFDAAALAGLRRELQALIEEGGDRTQPTLAAFAATDAALAACGEARKSAQREAICRRAMAAQQDCQSRATLWGRRKLQALEDHQRARAAFGQEGQAPAWQALDRQANDLLGLELPACPRVVPPTAMTPIERLAQWEQEDRAAFDARRADAGADRTGSFGASLFQGAVDRAQQEQADPALRLQRLREELAAEKESQRQRGEYEAWYQERLGAIYGGMAQNIQGALTRYGAAVATPAQAAPVAPAAAPPATLPPLVYRPYVQAEVPGGGAASPAAPRAAARTSPLLQCVQMTSTERYKQCVVNQCGRQVTVHWEKAMQGLAPGACYPSSDSWFGRLLGACESGTSFDRASGQCRH